MESISTRSGKVVVSDCVTRWNGTHYMIERLISIKEIINEVLEQNNIDALLASECSKLEDWMHILKPLKSQTDIVQN